MCSNINLFRIPYLILLICFFFHFTGHWPWNSIIMEFFSILLRCRFQRILSLFYILNQSWLLVVLSHLFFALLRILLKCGDVSGGQVGGIDSGEKQRGKRWDGVLWASKGANVRGWLNRNLLQFEFRFRNGAGRTLALQNLLLYSLDKCRSSCSFLHDAKKKLKKSFNVIFFLLYISL